MNGTTVLDIKREAGQCIETIEQAFQQLISVDSTQKVHVNFSAQENIALKKRIEGLTAENKQLVSLLRKYQASIDENLIYAEKNKQVTAEVNRLQQLIDSLNNRVQELSHRLALADQATAKQTEAFQEQREQDLVQFREALEERDRRKEEIMHQMDALKKQIDEERFKWGQEIQARDENVTKKQREIDELKREAVRSNQQHEQQLQRLRSTYEEQILQLTQIGRK